MVQSFAEADPLDCGSVLAPEKSEDLRKPIEKIAFGSSEKRAGFRPFLPE